ncbi:TetR/AcrR family transcriptional regulator [Nocardioides sp. ChNu-153]|uniref:TetR/AcrR family transcriptional regulator n=1 Tax=unclassified Nocardioides TaxID=2615069 RepID=UPI0024056357|nr:MULTISPECIES: TetR/AcrR family transcriptional regulator [unclassified Nocardioides]MDF9716716.1 TetR/AcrR family transcriptional regulator [Nocardioides sp. ChNu-99]MDN7121135.1 TetR/AcrR family transcriptional regulator [Nocardioides sp. ChNu-153]
MSERRTPRQIAREETLVRIKTIALAQLAAEGAPGLSLRAIARELEVVSSAVYRYFSGRDELLTALIVDAYGDLAARLEAAGSGRGSARARWTATCDGLRAWAVAEPHRFALVYGSAIPGYRAPATTIEPAARVVRAFAAAVPPSARRAANDDHAVSRTLAPQLAGTAEVLDLDLEPPVVLWLVGAFARVLGALTLELNGHLVGGFEPADDLFEALVAAEAAALAW